MCCVVAAAGEISRSNPIEKMIVVASVLLALLGAAVCGAAPGRRSCESCATRDYYNAAARLPWANVNAGDWRDADGEAQGSAPWATVPVVDRDEPQPLSLDLTALVRRWAAAADGGARALALRCTNIVHLHSRETQPADAAREATLAIVIDGGSTMTVRVDGDTYLEPSTYRNRGELEHVVCSAKQLALLFFDQSLELPAADQITSATLSLTSIKVYSGNGDLQVFELDAGRVLDSPPPTTATAPLSTSYPFDEGIEDDPDVWYVDHFDDAAYATVAADKPRKIAELNVDHHDNIAKADGLGFAPIDAKSGDAVSMLWRAGSNYGGSIIYNFKENVGSEPTDAYFRYYVRLADDWKGWFFSFVGSIYIFWLILSFNIDGFVDGGKMPGFSGTYNECGWGGRRADPSKCWSARGQYFEPINDADNPFNGGTPFGSYIYHADQKSQYGDSQAWTGAGAMPMRNKWTCIEQHVSLNDIGAKNGFIEAWIDGKPAFRRNDMEFRTNDNVRIERVWMNFYHGGTATIVKDQHLFIDELVIAKKRIGCRHNPNGEASSPEPQVTPGASTPTTAQSDTQQSNDENAPSDEETDLVGVMSPGDVSANNDSPSEKTEAPVTATEPQIDDSSAATQSCLNLAVAIVFLCIFN